MTTKSLVARFAVCAAAVIACSSATPPAAPLPCNQDPFQCASGTTCWPKDSVPTFACLTSAAAKAGDACKNLLSVATCGDAMACVQLSAAGGTCAPYCDPANPAHGCATGSCVTLLVGGPSGPQIHVCYSEPAVDAGAHDSGANADAAVATDAAAD